jgi:hypothetical protein
MASRIVRINNYLGDQHKKQRKMLNPVFSIAHMREMGSYKLNPLQVSLSLISSFSLQFLCSTMSLAR